VFASNLVHPASDTIDLLVKFWGFLSFLYKNVKKILERIAVFPVVMPYEEQNM
jgi:hypothetical protein